MRNNIFNLVVISLVVLSGCREQTKISAEVVPPQCIENQVECVKRFTHGELSLKFGLERIVSESSFPMYLHYQGKKNFRIVNAHLQGKDMYMGKIPLFFKKEENKSGVYKATGLLGSCADEEMVWTLLLTVEFDDENNESLQPPNSSLALNSEVEVTTLSYEFSSFKY